MNESEAPTWVRYAGDIFFLLAFLVVLFFFKPEPIVKQDEDEDDEALQPNPLEKILVSEEVEEDNEEEAEVKPENE